MFDVSNAHLESFVDKSFVEQLFEDPPDGLHVPGVHRLVVVLEIDPATQAGHDLLETQTSVADETSVRQICSQNH